jgi:hypothetical protein
VEEQLGHKLEVRQDHTSANDQVAHGYTQGLLVVDMRYEAKGVLSSTSTRSYRSLSCTSVHYCRMLDAEAELRRKFNLGGAGGRRVPQSGRGRTVRSSMVKPQANWPRMQRTGRIPRALPCAHALAYVVMETASAYVGMP